MEMDVEMEKEGKERKDLKTIKINSKTIDHNSNNDNIIIVNRRNRRNKKRKPTHSRIYSKRATLTVLRISPRKF